MKYNGEIYLSSNNALNPIFLQVPAIYMIKAVVTGSISSSDAIIPCQWKRAGAKDSYLISLFPEGKFERKFVFLSINFETFF